MAGLQSSLPRFQSRKGDKLRWEFIKENKKVRKQELKQESDQEKQENKNSTKKTIKKKRKTFFFS